ncbi:helix-turn-helix transcriptional regulator [Geodermatophilus sp. SYSU D00697]
MGVPLPAARDDHAERRHSTRRAATWGARATRTRSASASTSSVRARSRSGVTSSTASSSPTPRWGRRPARRVGAAGAGAAAGPGRPAYLPAGPRSRAHGGRDRARGAEDPARPWTVAALAEEVGVSRATLARRSPDLVGEPPMAYLTGWRLCLAADLLAGTDATVEAVARQVGYGSGFGLSVAFTRVYGTRPSTFRTPTPA